MPDESTDGELAAAVAAAAAARKAADAVEDAALTEALAAVGDEGDADDEDDEGAEKPKPKPKARRAAKAHRAAINAKRKRPDRDDFFALMFLARCMKGLALTVTPLRASDGPLMGL